jgi:hypothetical protein
MTRLRRFILIASTACALGVPAWAALVPIGTDAREVLFEIPKGTWAHRRAGHAVDILPSKINLVLEIRDVLLLRNLDVVPQMFGPTLIMPGQSFRLPFDVASEYQFACTAHVSGEMTVVVDQAPKTPWQRLRWRTGEIMKAVTRLSRERFS